MTVHLPVIFMKHTATIQVDLDGLWTNLQYYGHNVDVNPDTVFETSIPRYLDLFKKYNVKATFFLIGKDAEVPAKANLIKKIIEEGHEIANHTYSHVFGLRNLSTEEKMAELKKGEKNIIAVTGKKPVGFKSPGYDLDEGMLNILEREGYLYDSSVIPTPFYPLIMAINRLLSGGVKRTHGPRMSWIFAPNTIYHPSSIREWRRGNLNMKELPCTVVPFLRLPYHATFATKFGYHYFRIAQFLTEMTSNSLNYEFHAADLCDDIKDERMPHLNAVPFEKRYSVCEAIIKYLSEHYQIVTSEELVKILKIN